MDAFQRKSSCKHAALIRAFGDKVNRNRHFLFKAKGIDLGQSLLVAVVPAGIFMDLPLVFHLRT